MGARVFLSWEPSNSRSSTLAREFSADCVHVHYLKLKQPLVAPFKYVIQTWKSWQVLRKARPDLVFVQNPPVIAPLAVWLYCSIAGSRFIIDSHTGVFLERKWKWLDPLHQFLVRRAEVSIVTNEFLGQIVAGWGGRYFIFPDVPTEFQDVGRIAERPERLVTVVNSFSYDEPLDEVLAAAKELPEVSFAVTGDVARCPRETLLKVPANVRFTGFIPKSEYVDTLNSSDAAIVLTTEDHTMQRGAYEAMSLGVPVITSNWPLLRDTFFRGARFTDNTAEGIVAAVRDVFDNLEQYKTEIRQLKVERRLIWKDKLAEFATSFLSSGQSA